MSHPQNHIPSRSRPNWQQEGYTLFVSYVGAVCVQSGYNVVQDWIGRLLEASIGRM